MGDRAVKLSDVREVATRELNGILDRVTVAGDKRKGVILDPGLVTPLRLSNISQTAFTKDRGVQFLQTLDVLAEPTADGIRSLVLLVRPSLDLMRHVAATIERYHNVNPRLKFFVFFVPRKTLLCVHMLETEYNLKGIVGDALEIEEFDLDFFPLDTDVLSMELPHLYRDLYLEGDTTSVQYMARALVKLQTVHTGPIPRTYAKGHVAARVLGCLQRALEDVGTEFVSEVPSQVEALYIIDRSVDTITPMLSQLTYEGLIDEAYGINTCEATFPFPVAALESTGSNSTVLTSTTDRVFEEIRDLNFSQVGAVLHQKSLLVKTGYDKRKEATEVRQLRDFMRGLKDMQETHRLLQVHADVATALGKKTQHAHFRKRISVEQDCVLQQGEKEFFDFLDELIHRDEDVRSVMRLACLYSAVYGGIKPKQYDALRESLQLTYGIPQTITMLFNLERAGLLTKSAGGFLSSGGAVQALGALQNAALAAAGQGKQAAPFSTLRRACRLWVENLNEKQPNDVGYAYSGYAPLLLRTVEAMAEGNRTLLDQIPGEFASMAADAEVAGTQHTTLVFIVGGCTHAEANAIRLVLGGASEHSMTKRQYIVATTAMTNGTKLVGSLLPFDV